MISISELMRFYKRNVSIFLKKNPDYYPDFRHSEKIVESQEAVQFVRELNSENGFDGLIGEVIYMLIFEKFTDF